MEAAANYSDLDTPISGRELPEEIVEARRQAQAENELIEPIAKPRIEANLMASQLVLDTLTRYHAGIADKTDLDLTRDSRGAAIWMVAGRCLGLGWSMLALARAGIDNEIVVIGRAIHEAARILLVFNDPDEEELLRHWLKDEGKHGYVKPAAARAAQDRFEAKLDEAMEREGVPSLGRTAPLSDQVYDQMSRTAHCRRSSCANSVSEPLRQMSYGYHPSPLRRAGVAEWTASMTVEIANTVGDALRAFYGPRFFVEKVGPLIQSIAAVRLEQPLGRDGLLSAAGLTN